MNEQSSAPAKRGRPTLRTEAIVEHVLEQLCEGIPLAEICRADGMPSPRTFNTWVLEDKKLTADYARAREEGFDAIAADMLRISNTPLEAFMDEMEMKEVPGDHPGDQPRTEMVITKRKIQDALNHRRLQVDTRKWLLSKWDPKRYGERLALEHDLAPNLADSLKAARERAKAG